MIRSLVITLLFLFFPSSDKIAPEVRNALSRADDQIGQAWTYYVALHDYLMGEYEKGKTDIPRYDWDRKVLPLADKAVVHLDRAIAELDEAMPEKVKTDFWKKVYEIWYYLSLDTKNIRGMDFYQSEYLQRIGGYPSFLHMYLAILDGKFRSIEGSRGDLQELLGTRQNRVSFNDIRLGTSYREFVRALKQQGFKMDKERVEEQSFYGTCKEGFLLGTVDGNPAVVHVTASCKSLTVFEVEVVLRELIDEDEAIEEANRVMNAEWARYNVPRQEDSTPVTMFIALSKGGRVTEHLCYPKAATLIRLYEYPRQTDPKESFGSISMGIYENSLGHEFLVSLRYYDRAAGDLASKEAKK